MKPKHLSILYCFLSAFIFLTICSKSSFIYPMNDWGDTNCYFILGKGLLHGMVPYKDYFEQKGIVIYAIYAISVLMSETSFIGVYVTEVLFFALFLVVSLKIIGLYFDIEKYSFISVMILGGVVCSSALFCHGGSPEELLLVFFAYGIYLGLKYLEKDELPKETEMFLWGIFAGVIFFSKFTLCIIYLSIILFVIIKAAHKKQLEELLQRMVLFLLGCIVISIFVSVYFLVNSAFDDLINVYFYQNIFGYNKKVEFAGFSEILLQYTGYAKFFFRLRNTFIIILIIIGEIWLILKKKYYVASFQVFTFASFYYLEFISMRPRKYYGLPLAVLAVFGICAIIDLIIIKKIQFNILRNVLLTVLTILLAIVVTDNRYYMFKSKGSIPQYIFAEEMDSYGYKDYHMLYFGTLDQGYYFASGTLPNCKAFVTLNLQGDELFLIQKEHINEKKCEFIVTENILCDSIEYEDYKDRFNDEKNIIPFDNFGYEKIDELDNFFENRYFKVRLYKVKP